MSETSTVSAHGNRYENGVVIITGGSRGIGEACVKLFCEHGAKVVFCSNVEDDGKRVEKEVLQNNSKAHCNFVLADVTVESDVANVIDFCVKQYNTIDCLVNNVGWHPRNLEIDSFSADDFRKLFEINVMSHFLFSKYALPYLRKSTYIHGASIVNISSMVNIMGQPQGVTYVATKGAVAAMTRALAIDEAKHKVRVNSVSPSNADTPLQHECAAMIYGDVVAGLKKVESYALQNRMCSGKEVAQAILYLAAEGTFCTGIDLFVSGGCELAYSSKF